MSSADDKDIPQNTQDLTVFVQNLLQQMVNSPYSLFDCLTCQQIHAPDCSMNKFTSHHKALGVFLVLYSLFRTIPASGNIILLGYSSTFPPV
jgi:hypothetical protein